jgi:hypothetical protein
MARLNTPCNRPFDSIFMKEKIQGSWAKVGFVPFTRNCVKDKKVRKELGQQKADEQLENLQRRYDLLVDSFEGDGFHAGIFDLEITTAAHVIRAETEDLQAEELVKTRKAFSVSGQWNHCDSRIGNAGVTIKAQTLQLELNLNAQLKVANTKNEAQSKTLEMARSALVKFKFDSGSMNDKDWGDLIRWVLLEAKVNLLLQDLKKKEDILAKLATLPNSWTIYIPCMEETLAVVPTTTV